MGGRSTSGIALRGEFTGVGGIFFPKVLNADESVLVGGRRRPAGQLRALVSVGNADREKEPFFARLGGAASASPEDVSVKSATRKHSVYQASVSDFFMST